MLEPGFPCSYCGVSARVACRHRPAEAAAARQKPVIQPERKPKRDCTGNGRNFHRRGLTGPTLRVKRPRLNGGFLPDEKAWILATPLQEPLDSGVIAWRAKVGSGAQFAAFAKRRPELFQRIAKDSHTRAVFLYRLTEAGAEARRKLESESASA